MRNNSNVEGVKIAEAAQELEVTSVTVRRYITEFNIETLTDKNGVKVLPKHAMDELREVRRLKDKDGYNNAQVLEMLDKFRASQGTLVEKIDDSSLAKSIQVNELDLKELQHEQVVLSSEPEILIQEPADSIAIQEVAEESIVQDTDLSVDESQTQEKKGSSFNLSCQTCGKEFEHSNPKLRDCLDCYRLKRKERKKTIHEKQKSVIAHPLVNKVISKNNQVALQEQSDSVKLEETIIETNEPLVSDSNNSSRIRNFKKAIEDTRQITGSIKRRLERPDLPESERRWLEQIYAYQLILHQGWKHLAEYKSGYKIETKVETSLGNTEEATF